MDYNQRANGSTAPPLELSDEHRRMLLEESGIDPKIVAQRGYRTVCNRTEIPGCFPRWQRVRGLLAPMFSPDGETTSYQLRPHKPIVRKDGDAPKYETPHGSQMIVDVHPRNRDKVRDASVPLWITEGIKKGDSLASRGVCAIALAGVWNYAVAETHGKELLPCWDHVALKGRRVYIVYDSDVMVKKDVQLALERLVAALEAWGADVRVIYLSEVLDA
jgi:hypothetical protein